MTKKKMISIVRRYADHVRRSGIPVEKVIIFGSQVQGTAQYGSDIDTCVISPIFGKDPHAERVRLMELTREVDLSIEPHPYSPSGFTDPYDFLAQEIKRTGVEVS